MWLEKLNEIKKKSGKTTDEIVAISGIPKGTLNKIFAGQTKDPQISTLKSIVNALGYTLDDLDDEPKNHPNRELPFKTMFAHDDGQLENMTDDELFDLQSKIMQIVRDRKK